MTRSKSQYSTEAAQRDRDAHPRELCGEWMPRAKAYCAKGTGHKREHASPATMEKTRRQTAALMQEKRKDPEYRATLIEKMTQTQTERRVWLSALKVERGCVDCGYNDHPVALEFDHLPEFEKVGNITAMLTCNMERLLREIAKCEVRCSNCHRIKTAERHEKFRG